MLANLRPTLVLLLLATGLLGLAYPAAVAGVAQTLFPHQANGSLIERGGNVVGSSLIGQGFAGERYFHGRPSAAGEKGYAADASGGSNLGPTSKALVERVRGDVESVLASDGARGPIPADLVTASGSGLDPHITPAAAAVQVARVSRARGLEDARVRDLVRAHTEEPLLGFLGERRVNVLRLNLALDAQPQR